MAHDAITLKREEMIIGKMFLWIPYHSQRILFAQIKPNDIDDKPLMSANLIRVYS